jgi:hypothetical protein
MAEVLAKFPNVVTANDGVGYTAQVCGGPAEGLWEGWVEFAPLDGGPPIRSPRETTQPNRTDALYWANGLSAVYLEGALQRALHPLTVEAERVAQPAFGRPAAHLNVVKARSADQSAVLDPFSVYQKGEGLLRQELSALSAWHLVNIIVAYNLSEESEATLNQLSARALAEVIVTAVRHQATVR